jgi:hypothetical protein
MLLLKLLQRTAKYPLLLLSAFLVTAQIILSGCSHTTAYIRPGIPTQAQPEPGEAEVGFRLILIGDAGEPAKAPAEPVLNSLRERAALLKDRTTIVFLGDNIYPDGLPAQDDPKRSEMQRKLDAQIEAVKKSGADGIFVPGNHDWNSQGEGGQAVLKNQEVYVVEKLGEGAFQPKAGCPGPVTVDFAGVRLIVIDTQWWQHNNRIFC